ncbi:hypothetical protein HDA40_006778 [Hamadaea flava]|uniref:Uncharacterized protein n=1 Tax=Hamadaea flava TaxID=1742688 RepID=A0ABV8LS86_9ACTN|nr:hypothetical protein [Hamadaea flava]
MPVTALTVDVCRWMWWPGKLFRKQDPSATPVARTPEPVLEGA